jgi:hypothetical protein
MVLLKVANAGRAPWPCPYANKGLVRKPVVRARRGRIKEILRFADSARMTITFSGRLNGKEGRSMLRPYKSRRVRGGEDRGDHDRGENNCDPIWADLRS